MLAFTHVMITRRSRILGDRLVCTSRFHHLSSPFKLNLFSVLLCPTYPLWHLKSYFSPPTDNNQRLILRFFPLLSLTMAGVSPLFCISDDAKDVSAHLP
jgi:hypothetical protein